MYLTLMVSNYFKMELCLNRGQVWKFLGWKLMILTVFLYNGNPLNNFKIISQDKRAVRLVGFENSKVIGSLYF